MRPAEAMLYPVTRTRGHWISRRARPFVNNTGQVRNDGDELAARESMVWDFWVLPYILKQRIRWSLGYKASKVETGK